MEQLKQRFESFNRALATLDEIIAEPFSVIIRDAAIQRFEYTFETCWKAVKGHLKEYEGSVCDSPKRCFRQAMKVGILSAEDTEKCLAMTDDRNSTSHTYIEAVATSIYGKLPEYAGLMRRLLEAMKKAYKD